MIKKIKTAVVALFAFLLIHLPTCHSGKPITVVDPEREEISNAGTLEITLLDAGSYKPITKCTFSASRLGDTEEVIPGKAKPARVGRKSPAIVPDGKFEFVMSQGVYQMKFWSEGYRGTWTKQFKIYEGRTTTMFLLMWSALDQEVLY